LNEGRKIRATSPPRSAPGKANASRADALNALGRLPRALGLAPPRPGLPGHAPRVCLVSLPPRNHLVEALLHPAEQLLIVSKPANRRAARRRQVISSFRALYRGGNRSRAGSDKRTEERGPERWPALASPGRIGPGRDRRPGQGRGLLARREEAANSCTNFCT